MLDQLQLILKALPWTGPAILSGGLLGLLTMLLFPRHRSRSDRVGFALVVWCLVVAGVVTLSPVKNDYFGVPTTGCDWSIWRPLARQYWFSSGSRPPNVWLLFPAGLGVMIMDGFWRRFLLIGALFALPPGVETLQDLYPELKRSCSSQDVADNWTGLVLGLLVGLVLAVLLAIARFVRRRVHARRERRDEALRGAVEVPPDEPMSRRGRMPLGGGAHDQDFDDFSDFDADDADDRAPRDSAPDFAQWHAGGHAQGATQRVTDHHTPPYGTPVSDAETRAVTQHGEGYSGRGSTSDDGATRVMPTSGRGAHGDATEVIRRRD